VRRRRSRRRGDRAKYRVDRRARDQRRRGDRADAPRARLPEQRGDRDRRERGAGVAGPEAIREVPAHRELDARDECDPPEQTRGRHGAPASYPR
jgi:hypothetical protein